MDDLDGRVRDAIRLFWSTRDRQAESQGSVSGTRDAGLRTAVTGGKHLDGFVLLCRDLIVDAGIPESHIHWEVRRELPGFYRPEKNWDLLAIVDGTLLAVIEFKAQVGPSFGNNFNNRAEETLGNATDLRAAYREGAFAPSSDPWLGYVFILEDCPKSTSPVKVKQSHFPVFEEFIDSSYAKRYELLMRRLIRDRLYDGAALLLTKRSEANQGGYSIPTEELSFKSFATSLMARAFAFARLHEGPTQI